MKRSFDLLFCLLFVLLFWYLFPVVGLLVWLDSGRPIFYTQQRYGYQGNLFRIVKFRTMRQRSEEELNALILSNPILYQQYQTYRKLEYDPRLTRTGKILRRYSLDEIPQIVNVLKGELSLIGPRPYTLDELDLSDPADVEILQARPGITGWWQTMGRNEKTLKERKELDRFYVRNQSFWMDVRILANTFRVVISGTGK